VTDPVSWLQIEKGWNVVSADGVLVGKVVAVTGDEHDDIFDGLAVKSGARRYARRRTRSVLCRASAASLPRRPANRPALFANRPALLLRVHDWKGAASSARGVHESPHEYAVVWRTGDGPTSSGRLELGGDDLVLLTEDSSAETGAHKTRTT